MHFALYCLFYYYLLDVLFFSNERKKGDEFRLEESEKELGRIEGKETAIKIYYMKKMSVFNKRKIEEILK